MDRKREGEKNRWTDGGKDGSMEEKKRKDGRKEKQKEDRGKDGGEGEKDRWMIEGRKE